VEWFSGAEKGLERSAPQYNFIPLFVGVFLVKCGFANYDESGEFVWSQRAAPARCTIDYGVAHYSVGGNSRGLYFCQSRSTLGQCGGAAAGTFFVDSGMLVGVFCYHSRTILCVGDVGGAYYGRHTIADALHLCQTYSAAYAQLRFLFFFL